MYDVIVVGARCAGSPTAMLLARKGYKVLLVDKAKFPSDTVSTHFLWPHGAEALGRWGLLTALAETGLPPICRNMRFDVGPFALRGTMPGANAGQGGFCPRRTVLDNLLVYAAVQSGAEMREAFRIESLLFDGETVVGVRGREKGGGRSRNAPASSSARTAFNRSWRRPSAHRNTTGVLSRYVRTTRTSPAWNWTRSSCSCESTARSAALRPTTVAIS
jgi:flavin-dependent dehydrogenase